MDRLPVGRTLGRAAAGLEPVADRPSRLAGLGEVQRDQFRRRLGQLGPPFLQRSRDGGVELPPSIAQEGAVGRVADQRVLEQVAGRRSGAGPEDQPGCSKPDVRVSRRAGEVIEGASATPSRSSRRVSRSEGRP
jgi:hypothetical protein